MNFWRQYANSVEAKTFFLSFNISETLIRIIRARPELKHENGPGALRVHRDTLIP